MEGLKLIVGADVTQAERALDTLVKDVKKTGVQIDKSFGRNIQSVSAQFKALPAAIKPANTAVSKLGDTIETLRAKLLAKQSFLITETDINKIATLNREMAVLQNEITRVGNAGKAGFDNLGNALTKTVTPLNGVAAGAGKAFGALRSVAYLIPGIGIAGLVSGLTELVIGLFKTNNAFDEGAVAAAKYKQAIEDAKASVRDFFTSDSDIEKLRNRLRFGEGLSLDLANFKVDKNANDKTIAEVTQQIDELVDRVGSLRKNAAYILTKQGAELLRSFSIEGEIPDDLIDKLKESDQKILQEIKLAGVRLEQLQKDREASRKQNAAIDLESLIRQQEAAAEAGKKYMETTIAQARKLASFLDKTTIRSFSFDVDPEDSLRQSFEKARAFINRTRGDRSIEFDLKLGSLTEFTERLNIITPEVQKKIKEQALDLKDKLQKEIDRLPIAIGVRAQLQFDKDGIERLQKLSQGIGITQPDTSGSALTQAQQDAVKLANTVNGVLKPAFSDLFSNILAGKNPLQAFFQSIGDSIKQLLNQLIQAAIQALILSAIFPGGVGAVKGFGGFFKNITGFAAGGIVSGPTLSLIGEGIGTSRSNPEVVAPLDQLRSLIGSMAPAQQPQFLMSRIRGRDIVLSQGRTNRSQRRLGA